MMKERPILFSAPMVRAILDGRKTQTRRALKKQPPFLACVRHAWFNAPIYGFTDEDVPAANWWKIRCPYGQPGDRLWVRENAYYWGHWVRNGKTKTGRQKWKSVIKPGADVVYQANQIPGNNRLKVGQAGNGWIFRPAMFMPRWASRITLEITGVRVERLQDITEDDAKAEGAQCGVGCPDHRIAFGRLWESINGAGSWALNPWVWVVEFRKV